MGGELEMSKAIDLLKKLESAYDVFTNAAGEPFWGNVGVGILPVCRKTGRILLAKRSKYVNEPRTWGVIGGKIDDEKVMDYGKEARRELVEETGYAGPVFLIKAYVFKSPGGKFEYHNFIGVVPEEFQAKSNWETEKFQWMTWDESKRIRPKHFGLEALLKNSGKVIQRLLKNG